MRGVKGSQCPSQLYGHGGDQQGTHVVSYLVTLEYGGTQLVFIVSVEFQLGPKMIGPLK